MILIKGGNKTMNWLKRNVEVSEALMMLSMMPFEYQVVGNRVDNDADPTAFKYYLVDKNNPDMERHLIITCEAYRNEEPKDDYEEVYKPEYHLRTLYFKNQSDAYMAKGILEDMIKKSGFITCSEYYNICGRPTTQEDDEYGWIWNNHFQIKVWHSIYSDIYGDKKGSYALLFSTKPILIDSNFRNGFRFITELNNNIKKDTLKVYNYILPNKVSVNNVLQIAEQEINRKGSISVKYYYELAASSTNCTKIIDYSDSKYERYGWKDLDGVKIKKVKSGYKVIMPEATLLN